MGFFADHLSRHCDEVYTIKTHDGRPYLRRFVLMRNKWFRIFIHQIMISDEDSELHDHPWDFASFLLSNGYREEVPLPWNKFGETYKINWPRFSFIRHQAEDLHRIELEKPTWTLFIAGNRRRRWGFMDKEKGWIDHQDFFEQGRANQKERETFTQFMED